eukprot:jgi/Botrbrau1/17561/Bobra.0166s0009.1
MAPACDASQPATPRRRWMIIDKWREHGFSLGVALVALALGSALVEWPIYLQYESSWHNPARRFAMEAGVSLLIALAAGLSPSLSLGADSTFHWMKLGGLWLILSAVWMVFGWWGPNGAICVGALLGAVVSLRACGNACASR